MSVIGQCRSKLRQGTSVSGKRKKKQLELGLTERLILSMASEMAAAKLNTDRACIIFQALALAAGVNVLSAFETVTI